MQLANNNVLFENFGVCLLRVALTLRRTKLYTPNKAAEVMAMYELEDVCKTYVLYSSCSSSSVVTLCSQRSEHTSADTIVCQARAPLHYIRTLFHTAHELV
jgi:hypothetical protein